MCEFCQSNSKHKVQEVSVNAHLHTPYSFSAFDTLTDALNRAVAENVKVVGINDFLHDRRLRGVGPGVPQA